MTDEQLTALAVVIKDTLSISKGEEVELALRRVVDAMTAYASEGRKFPVNRLWMYALCGMSSAGVSRYGITFPEAVKWEEVYSPLLDRDRTEYWKERTVDGFIENYSDVNDFTPIELRQSQ